MRLKILVLAGAMTGTVQGAWAVSGSDIVWPTYDQVEKSGDAGLTCPQLAGEIHQVSRDVTLLNRAQTRVEDVLHSAFDMERYGGSDTHGVRVSSGAVDGKGAYADARVQIVKSLDVATARRDHLKSLEPGCRPAPQPAAAP